MKIKCPNCNGTGKEHCEVHGSHPCTRCNGQGCVCPRPFPLAPQPDYIQPRIPGNPREDPVHPFWNDKWKVWC